MGSRLARRLSLGALLVVPGALTAGAPPPDIGLFAQAAGPDDGPAREALERIAAGWEDGYAALILDLARFMRAPSRSRAADASQPAGPGDAADEAVPGAARDPFGSPPEQRAAPSDPSVRIRERLIRFLETQTGERFGHDLQRWRQWLWNRPYDPHPDYPAFKAALYGRIDPRMAEFFTPGGSAMIRLDEIDWGGVRVNGIPPLSYPSTVAAGDARYLGDKNVVFGISVNGEARAYPKRILAWHEMALDRLGGVELTIVYCTLCGTVVPYGSEVGGKRRTFGTSGLLYRSNKLMFDAESMSLWSSVEGRPVVGPLAGGGLELLPYPVVTTTWREWRAAHPDTTVLSVETGFERDYSEGAAYREYFATDRLMFTVPRTDERLDNKDEVLALLVAPAAGGERRPLAIDVRRLRRERLFPVAFAGREMVVVTSEDGANRVYDAGPDRLVRFLADGRVEDAAGRRFTIAEDAMRSEDGATVLRRLPARRAFWFGWYAQFPETELLGRR